MHVNLKQELWTNSQLRDNFFHQNFLKCTVSDLQVQEKCVCKQEYKSMLYCLKAYQNIIMHMLHLKKQWQIQHLVEYLLLTSTYAYILLLVPFSRTMLSTSSEILCRSIWLYSVALDDVLETGRTVNSTFLSFRNLVMPSAGKKAVQSKLLFCHIKATSSSLCPCKENKL